MMDKISNQQLAVDSRRSNGPVEKRKDEEGNLFGELLAAGQVQSQAQPKAQISAQGRLAQNEGSTKTDASAEAKGDAKAESSKSAASGKTLLEQKVQQLKAGEAQLGKDVEVPGARLAPEGTGADRAMFASHGVSAMRAGSADLSPLSMKSAASLNTGATIAGLKPWSRDWVFQTGDDENPELRGLFTPKENPPQLNGLGQDPAHGAGKRGDVTASELNSLAAANIEGVDSSKLQNLAREIGGAMATLQAMNTQAPNGATSAASGAPGKRLEGKLSGDDFLSTLGAVQAGNTGSDLISARAVSQRDGKQAAEDQAFGASKEAKPELRVIDGGLKKKSSFSDDLSSVSPSNAGFHPAHVADRMTTAPKLEIAGHVTSGAMAQDRLSTESLIGVSAGIRTLSSQGGGEIRVRLKPENLGELHLRVVTQGNSVGLQIQASDEKAKKIIEESISHLSDSLSSQSLRLAQVDVSVAQPAHGNNGDLRQDQPGWQTHSQGWDGMNQNGQNQARSDQGSQWGSVDDGSLATVRARTNAASMMNARSNGAGASLQTNGRLDVMA